VVQRWSKTKFSSLVILICSSNGSIKSSSVLLGNSLIDHFEQMLIKQERTPELYLLNIH
jgi:hypothetical protein